MYKLVTPIFLAVLVYAQAPSTATKAAAPKPNPAASAAAPNIIDMVIELKKGGMTDAAIIKLLQRENKPYQASLAETVKLNKAGISEVVMDVIADPKAAAGGPPVAASPKAPAVPETAAAPPAPPSGAPTAFPPDLPNTPSARKRRVAVKAFDYSTVRQWVSYWFQTDYNIGEGIRAMLVARMHQSKNITLLERTNLADVIKEQDLDGTNRIRKGTASKKGNLSGADCMLYGDIVIFGRDDKAKHNALVGLIPGVGTRLAALSKEEKAVVGINLRLVDTETGEVIESAEARGESSRKSKDYGAALGIAGAGAGAGSTGMTSSNFQATIIGEATSNAVDKVVAFLEGKVPSLPAKSRSIEGRIATIQGATVYLNVGDNDGVLPGDRFEILQVENELLDPATKEVIDVVANKIGEVVVATVRDKTSTGAYGGSPISQEYASIQNKGYAARLVSK
jgi:curli biogenesis system outer membrane secretion channel CsgG